MKKLITLCCYVPAFILLLASYSCKEDNTGIPDNYRDRVPENVRLSANSPSSITVTWDEIKGATAYTVQLLGYKESDVAVASYMVNSTNQYVFDGLDERGNYYARVRTHFKTATSNWAYLMNGEERARIIPAYGVVDEDFGEGDGGGTSELYDQFPEGWETHEGTRKKSYAGTEDIFPSGEWLMPDMYSISTASMAKNRIGDWALLIRGDGYSPYLTMNFDLPNGASKFSFYYGAATQNANDTKGVPIAVSVAYSQDGGETWVPLGDDLVVTSADEQYFKEYELDIKGPVRFRIGKDASNARLFIDEIAVYKN